jgi:hypothetical protein
MARGIGRVFVRRKVAKVVSLSICTTTFSESPIFVFTARNGNSTPLCRTQLVKQPCPKFFSATSFSQNKDGGFRAR